MRGQRLVEYQEEVFQSLGQEVAVHAVVQQAVALVGGGELGPDSSALVVEL